MKKLVVSTIGMFSLLVSTSALAAPPKGFLKVPEGFCQSIRFDKQVYRTFVELNALDKKQIAELARDPVFREALRRMKADRWGTQIASGQKARCESVTYWD
jgi:hypothetical protein